MMLKDDTHLRHQSRLSLNSLKSANLQANYNTGKYCVDMWVTSKEVGFHDERHMDPMTP